MVDIFGNVTVKMIEETCCNCGVLFAMPEEVRTRFLNGGGSFYCPNGHGQHFTKPRVKELEDKLMREQSLREQAEASAKDLQDKNWKMHGKLSRVYKRIKNGVCPCCNRHFPNLEAHMKTKHGIRKRFIERTA